MIFKQHRKLEQITGIGPRNHTLYNTTTDIYLSIKLN